MALFNTWTKANRIVDTSLNIRYRQERINDTTLPYWKVTRYATKNYKYVGLTENAAKECAAAMIAKYTRRYMGEPYLALTSPSIYEWLVPSVYECQASIAPHHDAGCAWYVQVDVNETDYQSAVLMQQDPSLIFRTANARDYDEDGVLRLTAATRSNITTTFDFEQNIDNFNVALLGIRYKTSPTAVNWTTESASRVHGADKQWVGCPNATTAPTLIMELTYNNEAIKSNAFMVEEA